MNLDIFKNKEKKSEKTYMKSFIEDLSNYVQNKSPKLELENGFYQVIDFGNGSVFLKNLNTNRVFEEKNIPEKLMETLFNDCILKYEDGKFSIDKEKTDEFMNGMTDIKDLYNNKK